MARLPDPELKHMYCPYPRCRLYLQTDQNNIVWWNKIHERYKCTSCQRTFSNRPVTFFAQKQHSLETIVEVLQLLAEGMPIRGISRVKHIKPETIIRWRRQAIIHFQEVEKRMFHDLQLSQVQIDEVWTFLKKMSEKENMAPPQRHQNTNVGCGMPLM